MKRSVAEIKRLSREHLMGNYRIMGRIFILAFCLPLILEMPLSGLVSDSTSLPMAFCYYGGELLIAVVSSVLGMGQVLTHLCLARKQVYGTRDVFYCFRYHSNHYFAGAIFLTILELISQAPLYAYTFLWEKAWTDMVLADWLLLAAMGLLSILLKLLFAMLFGLFEQVLLDREEESPWQCLLISWRLLGGSRLRMAGLCLSFAGMLLLSLVSLGMGLLYTIPYMKQAMSVLYLDCIGEEPAPRMEPQAE